MQHQTVPQTTVDLSHAGVDNILAALANAGIEVHYNETDGETFLDIWLTDLDADTPVVLGWRDSEGRQLRSWDSNDTAQPPTRKWPIEAGTHAEVARDVAAILADDEKPKPAASYRVTFDLMAGIEPMAFPPATTTDQVAYQVQRAFIAVDDMHPDNAQVAIDMEAGTVVVSVDGDVIEHGSITRVDEQPPAQPDYWLTLAADLRQIADRIATLAGTPGRIAFPRVTLAASVSARDAEVYVPVVDAIATAFGTTAGAKQFSESTYHHSLDAKVGGVKVWAYATAPTPEDAEKAALRAELETLRAQLAEGGATR